MARQPHPSTNAHGATTQVAPIWNSKQAEFAAAMQRYDSMPIYARINQGIAWFNVIVQLSLMAYSFTYVVPLYERAIAFVLAFILADFVNGLVHLIMDHNADYTSIVGPFVAAFHLHHDTPRYKDKAILQVYIDESGPKVWLFFYLLVLLGITCAGVLPHALSCMLIYFAMLSSLAEVSHFLCHNNTSKVVQLLQRCWIVLPKTHHMRHHRDDNVNYAFLNGMTDPVINWIAATFYRGYKGNTDQHIALYRHQREAAGLPIR